MMEKNAESFDITHIILKVFFIGIFLGSTFWIMRPFLIPLVWAVIIVISTWPVLLKLESLLGGKRGLAVTIMTLLILLIVLIPLILAVLAIVNNADDLIARIRALSTTVPLMPPWLEKIPLAGSKLAAKWGEFAALTADQRTAMVTPYVKTALLWFIAQAGNVGMTLVQFLLTAIITAILYAQAETVRSGILSFVRRLAGQRGENVAVLAAMAIRGVAMGVVLTALIQTAIGGIGLVVVGVPAVAILIAIMFMLCLAQIGPALVLIPVIIWLYMTQGAFWGTVLLAFTIPALTLDNIIRPILIKKGADLPLLLIFAGVIGGLIAFGIIGLFIGPVMLAITFTLIKFWVSGEDGGEEMTGEEPV
jgi:predicted PurR-regulated permease PerM